jgi:GTPase
VTTCLIIHPILLASEDSALGAHRPFRTPQAQLDEAIGLSAAMQFQVAGTHIAKVTRVSPGHLLGSGARDIVKDMITAHQPDVVIINHTLSPVQQRNLEKDWDVKVIDRTGLILEIFGARAQTAEGKIQVELAALNYQRSRLVRTWSHLERQRGGSGVLSGPGESQLETDRRLIGDQIIRLKRDLEEVRKHRELERRSRAKIPFPIVAIVGYTNAGKSTLFNKLTGAQVFAQDLLFATLDTTMRRLHLPAGTDVILSDTVGFISDLPTHLVAAFRATLEQLQYADLILHVRDVTAPDFAAQHDDVVAIMRDLGVDAEHSDRVIEVWNKVDALDDEARTNMARRARENEQVVLVSAHSGAGLDDLATKIEKTLTAHYVRQTVRVKASDGRTLAWLHAHAQVISQTIDEDVMVLDLQISPADWARFNHLGHERQA